MWLYHFLIQYWVGLIVTSCILGIILYLRWEFKKYPVLQCEWEDSEGKCPEKDNMVTRDKEGHQLCNKHRVEYRRNG